MIKTMVLAAILALIGGGTQASAAPPVRPRLIVAISVDQLSADLFAEYRARFSGGLRRLSQGAVFPSGYQSHGATETCPGHATMMTGARPARNGIIANDWFDLSLARPDKRVYCAEDPTLPGSSAVNYRVSPGLLRLPTLGDRLKAENPASRVFAVAGKDRAAVMMGGHRTDQLWFWGGKSFVTLADRTESPPAPVADINRRATALIAAPGTRALPPLCASLDRPVMVGGRKQVGRIAPRRAGDSGGFRADPAFDRVIADLAIGLAREMKLGRGQATDLLAIGLSATDYVGHFYGTEGAEMCAQLVALDATIGRILAALDGFGIPYAVVLTADHGGHDLPERNRERGIADAARVDPALSPGNVAGAVAPDLGISPSRKLFHAGGPSGDWYLAPDIPHADRPRILAAAAAKLRAHPQVAGVFTADELRAHHLSDAPVDEWTLADRARASFDPARSGDLVLFLKPHVTPIADGTAGMVATHGSPWNYDRRVPILFWWPGIAGFEQPLPIEVVDIVPSLAGLIGLAIPPGEIDGRCLDLDPGEGTTCPR